MGVRQLTDVKKKKRKHKQMTKISSNKMM